MLTTKSGVLCGCPVFPIYSCNPSSSPVSIFGKSVVGHFFPHTMAICTVKCTT